MLNLVLDILDIQKFENTQIDLNCENILLQEVISRATTNISGSIQEKNLDIQLKGQPGSSVYVDVSLIERVFANILGNAIKFSDNNAKILIYCEDLPDDQFVKVSITDFGPGIEAEKIAKVFLKFSQINSQKSGSMRSTGLGLAFCKMVIQSHQCEIGVESELDQSTTFWFTLRKSILPKNAEHPGLANSSNSHQFSFTLQDMAYLEAYLVQMKALKYYEIGKLIPILSAIDQGFSVNIEKWKTEMENAVYANNELIYNMLRNDSMFPRP